MKNFNPRCGIHRRTFVSIAGYTTVYYSLLCGIQSGLNVCGMGYNTDDYLTLYPTPRNKFDQINVPLFPRCGIHFHSYQWTWRILEAECTAARKTRGAAYVRHRWAPRSEAPYTAYPAPLW